MFIHYLEVSNKIYAGCILGPVLFSICINDLEASTKRTLIKFALGIKLMGPVDMLKAGLPSRTA